MLTFKALVRPYCDYFIVVWRNYNVTLANKLQKLQNHAARILTTSSYDANIEGLFGKLGWRKLSTQRQMQKAIMVFKSLNGLTPVYLSNVFANHSDVTNYSLRDSINKLGVPMPHTNFLKNSFSYSGAVLWNSLPPELWQAESLNDFCLQLNSYYS